MAVRDLYLEVSEYFKQFGSIKKCNVPFGETGFNKGYSWVIFHSQHSVHKVLKESHTLEGAQLKIKSAPFQSSVKLRSILSGMD
ncbi:PREDICTED: SRA stem-loop-interacting RNA-binding protein, mitochondrial isoform X2 [Crocodylus porosus]|uniref:SRA stem-loop-interacting RNA-binding protein, mitochondrial isoform X2 n=1 Tax=Crocodylus porosus TaxID=8502 RepID=UPI0009394AA8|nr:PREDICTED: SRA stem-loop-interacting RNA-binding protein, mitochondrial isoform X2 [Crocodylus porosus]